MNFNNADFEAAAAISSQLLKPDYPEIAFAGRSNVGKSTLINKLINRKSLARVSSTPGKTITINFYMVDDFRMVDLPGYGYAKVSFSEKQRWSKLMDEYFKSARDLRLVIQLIDFRHPPTEKDLQMIQFLFDTGRDFIIVATKSDKLKKTQREMRAQSIWQELNLPANSVPLIPFSSVTGEGLDAIKIIIRQYVEENA